MPFFNGIFFFEGCGLELFELERLYVCLVPKKAGRKISVKGALGVGGEGEE